MCNTSIWKFAKRTIEGVPSLVKGIRVIELGSRNVNGSVRPLLQEKLKPEFYVGVDAMPGPDVDVVWRAEQIDLLYPKEIFHLVITTEMLEHVQDWRRVIENLFYLCAPGGHILITTRSEGFPKHDYPDDHWRFSLEDMRTIFEGMEILTLRSDPEMAGVFCLVRKQPGCSLRSLDEIKLYNINSGERE